MPRLLIAARAIGELGALEPLSRRRRAVAHLSVLGPPAPADHFCSPGLFRVLDGGLRVLYRRRPDGTLVIVGVAAAGDAVHSERRT